MRDLVKKFFKNNKENITFKPDFKDNKVIKLFLYNDKNKINIVQANNEDISLLLSLTNLELSEDEMYLKITYENIYDLYYTDGHEITDDFQLLGLPGLFNGYINIENAGNFRQDVEVKYSFSFRGLYDTSNYDLNIYKNNILYDGKEYKVLPPDMYKLIKNIKKYNKDKISYTDLIEQFETFKIIKDYAEKSNVLLHSRLSDEEKPIIVDKITLDFNKTENGLEIYPIISDKNQEFNKRLLEKFDNAEQVRNFYNINDQGKLKKVIFKNKNSAEKIKRNRFLDGEQELKFYQGRNEIWEDDNFDLTQYGPRVKGFGYLSYRASDWSNGKHELSWFDLDPKNEFPKIYTNTNSFTLKPEDREKLESKLKRVNESGQELIEVEFEEEGKVYKVPMNKDQLVNEINKINSAIYDINDIRSVKVIEEILDIVEENPESEYIEYNGNYIRIYNPELIEGHLENIKNKENTNEKKNDKNKSLLVLENLQEEEYKEKSKIEQLQKLDLPNSLNGELFPHQASGVKKLQSLYLGSKMNGMLLADDMGLGKTLQLLTFLAWLKERNELSSALIVAPTTLIDNWDNPNPVNKGEMQKFFPYGFFNTFKLKGRINIDKLEELKSYDVVFTSYTSLRINHVLLGKIHWDIMICDEAQKVKNSTTQVSVAVKAQNADFKIACSATPIENSLLDLWNIVDYAVPGILGSRDDFKKIYVNNLSNEDATYVERKKINNDLVEKVNHNFLRRNKKDHLEGLPKKYIHIHGLKANQYEMEMIHKLNKLKTLGENPLPLIQKMLSLCSHPALINNSLFERSDINMFLNNSTKLRNLRKLINPIKDKNEKVLIFTIFKKMQKILVKTIARWYNFMPNVVNGETAQNKRTKIFNDFRNSEGFNILVLSPEVAGVGINLVEANHVIHYTRFWNPAKEDQATDRVYRIGQDKDVHVYYPILSFHDDYDKHFENEGEYVNGCLDTDIQGKSPEEKLNKLLVEKKNLLMNFFFAAGQTTIDWTKISENNYQKEKDDYININNIFDCISPSEFEVLISKLFQRKGYKTYTTVQSGDNGVDVVCIKDNKITLIQCKMTDIEKNMSKSAINELVGARVIYTNTLGKEVDELIVVSTSMKMTENTSFTASQNNVSVLLYEDLAKELLDSKIYYSEIEAGLNERYALEKLKQII